MCIRDSCGARNCAAHQLSTALGYDYTRPWDDFRSLSEAHSRPGEFDYVTPAIVCEWAKTHGHSCYFVKHGALLYKNVIDGHKQAIAFTEDRNHMLLYTTAAPFQNMVVKAIPLQVLPTAKLDKSPAWSEWRPWRGKSSPGSSTATTSPPRGSTYTRRGTCRGWPSRTSGICANSWCSSARGAW